jgi:hypothetical protein
LIPISHLALDLPAPATGWLDDLERCGIEVVPDDVGWPSITTADARRLFDEHREAEARKREVMQRIEAEAIRKDQAFRAQLWGGVRAEHMPPGAPAAVMLAAAKDARPRRTTPLEEALSNSGTLTFHPLSSSQDSE